MILSIDNVLKNYKMKMKLFFRISVLVLCILMSLSSFADDKKDRISVEEIDWSASNQSLKTIASTPDNPNKIYLYATKNKKFVTVGGRYGAQPILATILVSSLSWIRISTSILLIRTVNIRSPFICMWIVERTITMISMKFLLPKGFNGILSLFLIPIMVIKSILSSQTIWGDLPME